MEPNNIDLLAALQEEKDRVFTGLIASLNRDLSTVGVQQRDQEILRLKQEIEGMKLSRFWKAREFCVRCRSKLFSR